MSDNTPQLRDHPDTNELELTLMEYIDEIEKNVHPDDLKKLEYLIFETAVEAFYGEDVWKWINPRLK